MNRLIDLTVIIGLVCCLTGCSSEQQQLALIQEKIEEYIVLENETFDNQTELFAMKESGQSVYRELIELDIHDEGVIEEKLLEADGLISKQLNLLEDKKLKIETAYDELLKIEEYIQEWKDGESKDQMYDYVHRLAERKESLDSIINCYEKVLELQQAFYNSLGSERLDLTALDRQITEINERNEDMEEKIEHFNENTEQCNRKTKGINRISEFGVEDVYERHFST